MSKDETLGSNANESLSLSSFSDSKSKLPNAGHALSYPEMKDERSANTLMIHNGTASRSGGKSPFGVDDIPLGGHTPKGNDLPVGDRRPQPGTANPLGAQSRFRGHDHMEPYDSIEGYEIPLGDEDHFWDPTKATENQPGSWDPNPDDEPDGIEESNEGSKRGDRKKGKTRKYRFSEDRAIKLVRRSMEHTMVLHSLYVHRRLTINQIHQMYFSEANPFKMRSSIRKLTELGLLERKRIFGLAQSLADARTYHYQLSQLGLRIYALACMRVNMLHEDPDLPKQHFLHSDLAIRAQGEHHFMLQSFLSECIGLLWDNQMYLPSSEWRRYLYLNAQDEANYRPDWILFKPNSYFTSLVEENRVGEDILSVPVQSRTQQDKEILAGHYQPIVSIECDTGAMRAERLQEKAIRIKDEKRYIPKCTAILVGDASLGEESHKKRFQESKVRVRNVGNAVKTAIENELIQDELIFLVSRQSILAGTTFQYIQHSGDFFGLFPDLEAHLSLKFPRSIPMSMKEWKNLRLDRGLPDYAFYDKETGNTIAVFIAYPGWLNPHIKVNHLLERTEDYVECIMFYPQEAHFTMDTHHVLSPRLKYAALDKWRSGEQTFYSRNMDRSGERWEVKP